ncbi:cytochrome P450 [Actinoallomurus soli]|uniref:cytochrome P450 n=1 Tax=Actinoallomurus soli TaxID=2952535 RepID=UPI002092DD2B|nr:cytochrome P450 [Actinoallomurus soli]MCO5971643.1 cytochrome P450 [Actinoallomurus soli]
MRAPDTPSQETGEGPAPAGSGTAGSGTAGRGYRPSRLFDWLDRMRHDHPVWHDHRRDVWHVFSHAEALTVLSDWSTFSVAMMDGIRTPDGLELFYSGNFSWMDPPRHGRLRGLVSRVFTPRMIEGLAPRVAAVVAELLDKADGGGAFELIDDLAHPLPVVIIAEMLGVPAEDRVLFRRWADILLAGGRTAPGTGDDDLHLADMEPYLIEHIERRRAVPGPDLISGLVRAEVEGRRLSNDEIVGFTGALLIAGHITTTVTLGNAVLCLDENPGVAAGLRRDPGLIPAAVEEVLRSRPPFTSTARRTTRETELAGRRIPAGRFVNVWLASANRDEHLFDAPDRFDVHRPSNRHLAFGHGIHFCLGAPLARLETRIALEMLLSRYREIRVASPSEVEPHDQWTMIGAKRIPMVVERTATKV